MDNPSISRDTRHYDSETGAWDGQLAHPGIAELAQLAAPLDDEDRDRSGGTPLDRWTWAIEATVFHNLSLAEGSVMNYLSFRAGPKKLFVWSESEENIAIGARTSRSSVRRAIKRLVSLGLIAILRSGKGPNAQFASTYAIKGYASGWRVAPNDTLSEHGLVHHEPSSSENPGILTENPPGLVHGEQGLVHGDPPLVHGEQGLVHGDASLVHGESTNPDNLDNNPDNNLESNQDGFSSFLLSENEDRPAPSASEPPSAEPQETSKQEEPEHVPPPPLEPEPFAFVDEDLEQIHTAGTMTADALRDAVFSWRVRWQDAAAHDRECSCGEFYGIRRRETRKEYQARTRAAHNAEHEQRVERVLQLAAPTLRELSRNDHE